MTFITSNCLSQDIYSMQRNNNNTIHETNEKEEGQLNNNITNIDLKENKKIIDCKTKAD